MPINKHMTEVHELINRLKEAEAIKESKQLELVNRLNGLKQQFQNLETQLDIAILERMEGQEEKLLGEIHNTEKLMRQLENLHTRISSSEVQHVISADEVIKAFIKATADINEDVKAVLHRAEIAKLVYENTLTEFEQICEQQRLERTKVDFAIRKYLNKVHDGALPKLHPTTSPYVSLSHYRERRN
ncbi:MAG TPA: hypothetical protein VGE40_11290 [Bacilli bacterium]